jgi:hypothetical protein
MRTQLKGAAETFLTVDNRHGYGALVAGSGACASQYARSELLSSAVNDYSFKAVPGQLLNRGIRRGTMLHADFQFVQYAAQNANDFVVGTKDKSLEIHYSYSRGGAGQQTLRPM